MTVDWSL